MRVVIVDDEPLARRGVQARLARHADMQIVETCGSGREAVTAIRNLAPDLVFLDVQMPDMNGFEVLRQVPPSPLPIVIFMTAYDQYATRAFEVHALDYLLKPIDDLRFSESVELARARVAAASTSGMENRLRELLQQMEKANHEGAYQTRFSVRSGRRITIVQVEDIDWIQAADDYVTLHVGNHSHLLRQTMNQIEQQLNPERFIRVHRSTIVQASRIRELVSVENREFLLQLTNGTKLKTSRKYSDRIERWL